MTHPSLDDVRSAVEAGKKHIGTPDFMYPLVALGESYLEVEGLPEEKVIPANSDWVSEPYKSGFNSALSLCRLAYLKQAKRVEELEGFVYKELPKPPFNPGETWKQVCDTLCDVVDEKEKQLSQEKPI